MLNWIIIIYGLTVVLSFMLLPLFFNYFEKRDDIFDVKRSFDFISKEGYTQLISFIPVLNIIIILMFWSAFMTYKIRLWWAILILVKLKKKVHPVLKPDIQRLIDDIKSKL